MSDTETIEKPAKAKKENAPPPGLKATVERAELVRAMSNIQALVERRNTIPILANVLIEAAGDRISLEGTNLDILIRDSASAQVEAPGATTVPAALLWDIVREMPEGARVTLSQSAGRLEVAAGRSCYKLAALPPDDFPRIDAGKLDTSFSLPAATICRIIAAVRHAISSEAARTYLHGIFFEVRDGREFCATATDGHCLATMTIEAPKGAKDLADVILPSKTAHLLFRAVEGSEGDVRIEASDTKLRFTSGSLVIVSKAVDGTFPDWRRVLPASNDKRLQVNSDVFVRALKRVSVIASERTRAVKIEAERDRMTLSMTSVEHGDARDDLAVAYDAPPIEIGFNVRFLLSTLAAMGDGEQPIEVHMADPAAPTLFTNINDPAGRWVVMPMRV